MRHAVRPETTERLLFEVLNILQFLDVDTAETLSELNSRHKPALLGKLKQSFSAKPQQISRQSCSQLEDQAKLNSVA
jgi:hypothetical protein